MPLSRRSFFLPRGPREKRARVPARALERGLLILSHRDASQALLSFRADVPTFRRGGWRGALILNDLSSPRLSPHGVARQLMEASRAFAEVVRGVWRSRPRVTTSKAHRVRVARYAEEQDS